MPGLSPTGFPSPNVARHRPSSTPRKISRWSPQYGTTALPFFYSTRFFIYLPDARHMSLAKAGFAAAVPAIAGFVGGVLGGVVSDYLRKRGVALSPARKIPILVGLVISCAI